MCEKNTCAPGRVASAESLTSEPVPPEAPKTAIEFEMSDVREATEGVRPVRVNPAPAARKAAQIIVSGFAIERKRAKASVVSSRKLRGNHRGPLCQKLGIPILGIRNFYTVINNAVTAAGWSPYLDVPESASRRKAQFSKMNNSLTKERTHGRRI